MSFRIRAAREDDFPALYEMAKLTGGGFTNLPADKKTLEGINFLGNLDQFLVFLRTDDRFYYKTPEELFAAEPGGP